MQQLAFATSVPGCGSLLGVLLLGHYEVSYGHASVIAGVFVFVAALIAFLLPDTFSQPMPAKFRN